MLELVLDQIWLLKSGLIVLQTQAQLNLVALDTILVVVVDIAVVELAVDCVALDVVVVLVVVAG